MLIKTLASEEKLNVLAETVQSAIEEMETVHSKSERTSPTAKNKPKTAERPFFR